MIGKTDVLKDPLGRQADKFGDRVVTYGICLDKSYDHIEEAPKWLKVICWFVPEHSFSYRRPRQDVFLSYKIFYKYLVLTHVDIKMNEIYARLKGTELVN
jgi:hypothetical protein